MKPAVVLLSGGLDSSTCLLIAKKQQYACYTLSIDYGQRHRAELRAAEQISSALGVLQHKVVGVDLRAIGGSALTDDIDVPVTPSEGIPITYVPARNTIMLSIALGWAEVLGAQDIFIGVNSVDYSGYPDCRPQYIQAFTQMAQLATRAADDGGEFSIHTPLIDLSKSQIIKIGCDYGFDYRNTVSCYQSNDKGEACGRCDSCRIRQKGFDDVGIIDQTIYMSAKN